MSANGPEPVTLDEVRTRFLAAEDHLTQAAKVLRDMGSATKATEGARTALNEAVGAMSRIRDQFELVARALGDHTATLRNGVDALKQADPARLTQQVKELGVAVARVDETAKVGTAQVRDEVVKRTERIRGDLVNGQNTVEKLQGSVTQLASELKALKESVADTRAVTISQSSGVEARLLKVESSVTTRLAETHLAIGTVRTELRLGLAVVIFVGLLAWGLMQFL